MTISLEEQVPLWWLSHWKSSSLPGWWLVFIWLDCDGQDSEAYPWVYVCEGHLECSGMWDSSKCEQYHPIGRVPDGVKEKERLISPKWEHQWTFCLYLQMIHWNFERNFFVLKILGLRSPYSKVKGWLFPHIRQTNRNLKHHTISANWNTSHYRQCKLKYLIQFHLKSNSELNSSKKVKHHQVTKL